MRSATAAFRPARSAPYGVVSRAVTARRPADFSLASTVRDPGFTPRRGDRDALLDLLADPDEDTAEAAERVLVQLGVDSARAALARTDGARPPARGRLVRLAGRVAATENDPGLWDALVERLSDTDAKTRRNAVIALARADGHPGIEDALLEAWRQETRIEHRRSLAASLGRVGGVHALDLLRGIDTEDPELRRIAAQAVVTLERTLQRPAPSVVDPDAAPRRPTAVIVRCRAGLEEICAEEFDGSWAPEVLGGGRVRVTLTGPLGSVFRSRVMVWFGFPLPPEPLRPGEDAADALARALTSEAAVAVFAGFTRGAVRYRIAWAGGGHRRAAVWRCAAAVTARRPEIVNDPRDSTWEAVVEESEGAVRVTLEPGRLADPRFTWRRREVPAASHPTVAAALVRAAGVRRSDVVWDPFVGSGLELVERALLGPWTRLVGTDLDPQAVEAAQANLAAAGVTGAEVLQRDAFDGAPAGVTLVITNPPMGYRVGFGDDVGGMLEHFVGAVAEWLRPGGRMVWLSPTPDRTGAAARRAGLRVTLDRPVELGGLTARIQRYDRPFNPSRR